MSWRLPERGALPPSAGAPLRGVPRHPSSAWDRPPTASRKSAWAKLVRLVGRWPKYLPSKYLLGIVMCWNI